MPGERLSWPWRVLADHPRAISAVILTGFAASAWAVTVYIDDHVRPRQAATQALLIAGQIDAADSLAARGRYEAAAHEYAFLHEKYDSDLEADARTRLLRGLGEAHLALGATAAPEENFAAAAEALRGALDGAGKSERGRLQILLGDAYAALAAQSGDGRTARDAVAAYRSGIEALGDADRPAAAHAHLRLGDAFLDLGIGTADAEPGEAALLEYARGLALVDAATEPRTYARLLIATSRAHAERSTGRFEDADLKHAVDLLHDGQKILDRARFPRENAEISLQLGEVYTRLAGTEPRSRGDRASHAQRVHQYKTKARHAYEMAQSFGLRPVSAAGAGAGSAGTAGSSGEESTVAADEGADKK